jgi:hypothetical protein
MYFDHYLINIIGIANFYGYHIFTNKDFLREFNGCMNNFKQQHQTSKNQKQGNITQKLEIGLGNHNLHIVFNHL